MAYSQAQIEQFAEHLADWLSREDALTTTLFIRDYRSPQTLQAPCSMVARRLATLKHALNRTFEVLPPDDQDPSLATP